MHRSQFRRRRDFLHIAMPAQGLAMASLPPLAGNGDMYISQSTDIDIYLSDTSEKSTDHIQFIHQNSSHSFFSL